MGVEGRDRTAVFTDEASPEIDQAQYDSGEGPCVDAYHGQKITQIRSTRGAPGPRSAARRPITGS